MHKKIASELAIGIILVLAIVVGVLLWLNGQKMVLENQGQYEEVATDDAQGASDNMARTYLNYLGTEEQSKVFIDCQTDDDCYFTPEITNACSPFSINVNNAKEDIHDYVQKSAVFGKDVLCGMGVKNKSDFSPICSSSKECSYAFNILSFCLKKDKANVQKCGKYYRVLADQYVLDMPDSLYDESGISIGFCGGMPGPSGSNDAKECSIPCESQNLCEQSQKVCPADAKQCSDGSYVSRDANNNCAFKPCP